MKKYETLRHDISPKAFWGHVAKNLAKRGEDIGSWVGEYDHWIAPSSAEQGSSAGVHKGHGNRREANRTYPCDYQIYLEGIYNVIMQFEYDGPKRGTGYCYFFYNEGEA